MIPSIFSVHYWKNFIVIMQNSIKSFLRDKCFKMSASLAYYTTFSIGPLVLISLWCVGLFYGKTTQSNEVKSKIFTELTELFSSKIAIQIQTFVENISNQNLSGIGVVIGISTVIFTSTTIFIEIQDSLNTIWRIKPKPKRSWLKLIGNRLLSFSLVVGISLLSMVSLVISAFSKLMMNFISRIFPNLSLPDTFGLVNSSITFLLIITLFGLIFKLLPDAKVKTKYIVSGAIFTGILFMLGRYGILLYLQFNTTATAFGAAGSVIMLLIWIYFSAAILYLGAEFIKETMNFYDEEILPSSTAVRIEQREIILLTKPKQLI
ncbi:MAG: YihY/virulence factor BrkB family protein [Moheibacter sp.]